MRKRAERDKGIQNRDIARKQLMGVVDFGGFQ